MVAFLLIKLSHQPPAVLKGSLIQFWRQMLSFSSDYLWNHEEDESEHGSKMVSQVEAIYSGLLPRIPLTEQEEAELLAWCLAIANRRIEAIVGGLHRGSYDKAAMLVAACAETLKLRGENARADNFLSEISDRFPRHRAFQAELKTAIQRMQPR